MNQSRRYPMYSIQKNARMLLIILLPVLFLNIIISIAASSTASAQSRKHTDEIMKLYLDTLETQTKSSEHFVTWSVLHESLLNEIEAAQDSHTRANRLLIFNSRVSDFQYTTGKEYQFFLYLKEQDFFTNCSPLMVSYTEYLGLKEYYRSLIRKGHYSPLSWNLLESGGRTYLYYLITVDNRSLLCQIPLEALAAPLLHLDLGSNGYIRMTTGERDFCIHENGITDSPPESASFLTSRYLVYEREDGSLPLSIVVYMDRFSAFQKIILLQMAVVAAAVILVAASGAALFYMNSRVIRPIREFSESLASIREDSDLLNLQSSSIIELEQANEQFKNLMREIKKLKINIYENELEKKRIQMDFMKLQIRPHFYLNCLTTIYSMAQTQLYEEIGQMAMTTAKYLRYLLSNDKDFVYLEQEAAHVEDYLAIQKLRYGSVFTYVCEISPDSKDARIPPLILQTFVENAVKHAVSPDETIEIRLSVTRLSEADEDWLQISIINTGTGFPPEILAALERGETLSREDGTHIGITNAIQRLTLLYENNYSIRFGNLLEGGAVVSLVIPFQPL